MKGRFVRKFFGAWQVSMVIMRIVIMVAIAVFLLNLYQEKCYQEAMEEVSQIQKTAQGPFLKVMDENGKVSALIYEDIFTMRTQIFDVSGYSGKLLSGRNIAFAVIALVIAAAVWTQVVKLGDLIQISKSYSGGIYQYYHEDDGDEEDYWANCEDEEDEEEEEEE